MSKKGWIWGVALLLAGALVVFTLGLDRGDAPGFVLFLGRFHPVVVHFPIALLLLGAAVELLGSRSRSLARARPVAPFLLLLGALSSLAAVALGYMLSLAGGYAEGLLTLHLRLGLAVTALAFVLAFLSAWLPEPGKAYRTALAGLVALVVLAGHFGGSLARGSGYLTYYLPAPVKSLLGVSGGASDGLIANVDSAYVYADLVQPVLDRRCVSCHGPDKSSGALRLDTPEGIEEGGRDGPAFVAGYPAQSEILRRVTLPPYDEDTMPPDGAAPLDVGETEVIRWWIENGASFAMRVAEIEETPTAVSTFLARVSLPQAERPSGIFALDVPQADTNAVAALSEAGLTVSRLSPDAPFLHVAAASVRGDFGDAELAALQSVAAQIAGLDIGHTRVTDAGAAALAGFPHLVRLHLEGTGVGDAALEQLAELDYLEYLNLYGTQVTDAGLERVRDLPALQSIYLWRSGVTEAGAEALRAARSDLEVNIGSALLAVPDSTAAE